MLNFHEKTIIIRQFKEKRVDQACHPIVVWSLKEMFFIIEAIKRIRVENSVGLVIAYWKIAKAGKIHETLTHAAIGSLTAKHDSIQQ